MQSAKDKGLRGPLRLYVAPQVLFEYFAVVTNAAVMTVPLTAEDALADIEKLAATFPLVHPPHDLLKRVFALLRATGTPGRHIFDLQLVATMLGNGIATIYTYDARFTKIPGITARTP
jgi:predicted nucleic acid-binding protein